MHALPIILLALASDPGIVITEIMYDPASPERRGEPEWVEIANMSTAPVTMTDWRLDDEDQGDWGTFTATLAPGQVAVIINGDAATTDAFKTAWTDAPDSEPDFLILPVAWGSLANRPTADNEVLTLLDGDGTVVATVNYQQDNGWPPHDRSGGSIYMPSPSHAGMSDGDAWSRSKAGVHGARACRPEGVYSKPDIGSPGVLPDAASATPSKPPTAPRPAPPTPKPAPPPAPKAPEAPPATPKSPDPPPPDDDDIPY